ncbi:outer membrane beta-barrel protein [Prevotella koreensis]
MKKMFAALIVLVITTTVSAQEKRWEHNIYTGVGLFVEDYDYGSETGLSSKIGYGLNYHINEKLSVMPGIAWRGLMTGIFRSGEVGSQIDDFEYIDIPVIVQWHGIAKNKKWILGLGPVFSFCVSGSEYYIDHDPKHPLNGLNVAKKFNFGMQPSIMYKMGKWRIGLEGNIGLMNVRDGHGITTGTIRLHDIMATGKFCF